MADISFEVEGLQELEQALLDLGAEVGLRTLRTAGRKAMGPVHVVAAIGANVKSGDLRDAIATSTKRGKGNNALDIRVGVTRTKLPKTEGGRVLAGVNQKAIAQEFGTSKQKAEPFLRPALEQNAERVLSIFKTEMAKTIERAVKRAARKAAAQ